MERISQEHVGFNILSMKEFLELFFEGKFRSKHTGDYSFPPKNRTDWNDCTSQELNQLKMWLREEALLLEWDPEECMAAFPRPSNSSEELIDIHEEIQREGYPHYEEFVGKPIAVGASPKDGMRENWADRKGLCLYDSELQQAPWADLWTKRFIRDHVRYVDEIQCAAGRVVAAIRRRVQERNPNGNNSNGDFDTLHVRR
eukprot:scaffold11543_cov54-Cylindrotheca_fusiformis.AAC.1